MQGLELPMRGGAPPTQVRGVHQIVVYQGAYVEDVEASRCSEQGLELVV
jgi:hypothetical protein